MANQISPLARLFRGMADLIDHDHTSQTRYEAIAKAAGVVATRATTQQLVAGQLWQLDGAELLASAYALHAGLPRQAAMGSSLPRTLRPARAVAGGPHPDKAVTVVLEVRHGLRPVSADPTYRPPMRGSTTSFAP